MESYNGPIQAGAHTVAAGTFGKHDATRGFLVQLIYECIWIALPAFNFIVTQLLT